MTNIIPSKVERDQFVRKIFCYFGFSKYLFPVSIDFGFLILGFAIAQIVRSKSTWALRRPPYFFLIIAVITAASCTSFFGHLSTRMIITGNLWIYVMTIYLVDTSAGFLLGMLGHARSQSAHGTGKFAWLTIIPIANLYLHLKPPREPTPKRGTVHLLANITIVTSACLLFFFGLLFNNVGNQLAARKKQRILSNPISVRAHTKAVLNAIGLEETVRIFANTAPRGDVNKTTVLTDSVALGSTLRHEYIINADEIWLSLPQARQAVIEFSCNDSGLGPLLTAGGTVQHYYENPDGTEFTTVTVTLRDCTL